MRELPRRWKIFVAVSVGVLVIDQITKIWARHSLPTDGAGRGIRVPVIENFFDWVLAYNTGSAFSLLAGMPGARAILTVVGLAAVGAIGWMVSRARDEQTGLLVALALMAGGAVGNLVDRVLFGKVTDFVLWHWHEHTWPVFNVADAALSVAIAVFLASTLWSLRQPAQAR
jgi:signal peptidase II